MKIEIEKLVHISMNEKEYNILIKAMDLLREVCNELNEDYDIGNKAYDAAELIDKITDVVSVKEK